MIPGMDEDAPARPAPGEVVVDFDKINELKISHFVNRPKVSRGTYPAKGQHFRGAGRFCFPTGNAGE